MRSKNEVEDPGKRALIGKIIKGGAAVGVGMGLRALVPPEARADGSWIKYHWWRTGIPEGTPGAQVPLGLFTEAGNVVCITTGDLVYQDPAEIRVEFPGQGKGESRASLVICEGPVDGAAITVRATYNWVGVTQKPEGERSKVLSPQRLQELINERVDSLRSPNGGGLTGPIDVLIIGGETGRIRETRVIYP